MSTRYSRRRADGFVEYHGTESSLLEAQSREEKNRRAVKFAFIGLLMGGIAAYVIVHKFGVLAWPQWLRLSFVVAGALLGAALLARLASLIVLLIKLILTATVVAGVIATIWNYV